MRVCVFVCVGGAEVYDISPLPTYIRLQTQRSTQVHIFAHSATITLASSH